MTEIDSTNPTMGVTRRNTGAKDNDSKDMATGVGDGTGGSVSQVKGEMPCDIVSGSKVDKYVDNDAGQGVVNNSNSSDDDFEPPVDTYEFI